MQTITIRPAGDRGWMVEHESVDNPMVFRSGAEAERAAKRLAVQLADAGAATQITVTLRDGRVGARYVTGPSGPHPSKPRPSGTRPPARDG